MNEEKLEAFRKHAEATSFDTKFVYLVKSSLDPNQWGLLYVSDEYEESDKHCEQCINEPILFFGFKETKEFPYRLVSGTVGTTKFNRILNNEIQLLGNYLLDELLTTAQ